MKLKELNVNDIFYWMSKKWQVKEHRGGFTKALCLTNVSSDRDFHRYVTLANGINVELND